MKDTNSIGIALPRAKVAQLLADPAAGGRSVVREIGGL